MINRARAWVWAALALAGLAMTACETTETGDRGLSEAFDRYNAQDVAGAEAGADRFIAANPQSPHLDEAYYLRGLARFSGGNHPLAASDLATAIAISDRPDLKAKAHRVLGDIRFDQTRWAEAQAAYEQAAQGGQLKGRDLAFVNYRVGACLQAQGQWARAVPWFGKVATTRDDEALTQRALVRVSMTAFALQYGAFLDGQKARELLTQVQAAGIADSPEIVSEMRDGQLLFLVRSGSYPTWAQADAARDRTLSRFPLVIIVP